MRARAKHPGLRLYEAGAALLFFGALSQQADLHQAGGAALAELAAQGYQIPSGDDPVRIFPALTQAQFSSRHAGGWRPGSIYLRPLPEGGFSAVVYLRHELFHEASFRSCAGRWTEWAEEAAAMRFSGELAEVETDAWPSEAEIQSFKENIRRGEALDGDGRQTLKRLAAASDWPAQACAPPARLAALLATDPEHSGDGYLLMSLPSARILASGGDLNSRLPPGSLLKIPYAAALSQANPEQLGKELATSDTDKLLARRRYFQARRYRLLLAAISANQLPENPATAQDWRALLGDRGADGRFPVQASLPELALTLRAALLSQADYFQGLSQNGTQPDSTLAGQDREAKRQLQELNAIAKTGSVSSASGQPLYGHLLLAWPAAHPVYLAVFRRPGSRGAALLPKAAGLLADWRRAYPANRATVRVRLLSLTPRDSWAASTDCPEWQGPQLRFSSCGVYQIISTARGSRSERWVRGVLHKTAAGPEVLETDLLSYTDAVLDAEAKTLTGSARQALRAVIAWNGGHGQSRHRDTDSLCDSSHCMVFLGQPPGVKTTSGDGVIDPRLLSLLDRLAAAEHLNWLPFALGGEQRWQRQIPAPTVNERLAENWLLDIRRERRKNGGLFIHLYYPQQEETVSCEVFRNLLQLPSCPDVIKPAGQDAWFFEGVGAGHGLGLSLRQAQALADQGRGAEEILRNAYSGQNQKDNIEQSRRLGVEAIDD